MCSRMQRVCVCDPPGPPWAGPAPATGCPPPSPLCAAVGGRAGLPHAWGSGAHSHRLAGRRKGAGGHMAVASEQPGKSAPCTARVTTSGFGGGEKPRSPLCVHREGGAGCRVRDSSASRVLVSRYKGKGNTATGVSAPARKRRLSGLVFPRSPKAEPASAQRAELRNASPSLSRPQQLN